MTPPRAVAIVGGGPAGATCARELACAGADVTLFEARPCSEKPCGGGVPAAAIEEFPELAAPELRRRVVRDVVIHSPGGASVRVPLQEGRHGREGIHIFRRLELDSFLRERAAAAGARLVRTRVTGVRRLEGGGWELQTAEGMAGPFDQLIGADGVHSLVRRALAAGTRRERDLTLALYAYLPGVRRGEMVLKFFRGMDGYFWIFPREDHVSVGICAAQGTRDTRKLEQDLLAFARRECPESAVSGNALKGYYIPAERTLRAASDGSWALIGDAAGQVDPITREGIAWAMRSGREAARRLLATGAVATPEVPADLLWAHQHASGFFRTEFLESMARLARGSASIRSVLADLFSGYQGYRPLKRRLLLNALPCGVELFVTALRAGIP